MDLTPNEFVEAYTCPILSTLGKGKFEKVYKLRSSQNNMECAVKIIKLPEDSERKEQILKQMDSLRSLGHDNIAQVFHFSIFEGKLHRKL